MLSHPRTCPDVALDLQNCELNKLPGLRYFHCQQRSRLERGEHRSPSPPSSQQLSAGAQCHLRAGRRILCSDPNGEAAGPWGSDPGTPTSPGLMEQVLELEEAHESLLSPSGTHMTSTQAQGMSVDKVSSSLMANGHNSCFPWPGDRQNQTAELSSSPRLVLPAPVA
ncbi:hypothetical protein TREES_T100007433 [Tupaia chinensis]|uniref:Uncharacterized protein n=1 Tax=Tupaia chinensis TaxID=246437 RepID=L9KZ85_TUPCH|nr:hypothetical protein TREES_T100007433 [Tupaia chinensis]